MTAFCTARVAPEEAVFRPALPLHSLPGLNGTTMTKMTFAEQIKHPNWQKRRLQRLEAAGWECQDCYAKDAQLQVHHKRYLKGRLYWDYDDTDLIVLCRACHEQAHGVKALLDQAIASSTWLGTEGAKVALGLFAGFAHGSSGIEPDLANEVRAVDPSAFNLGLFAALSGIATRKQCAEFVEKIHLEFEHGPVALSPLAQATVEQWKDSDG